MTQTRREFLQLNIHLAFLSLCGRVDADEISPLWSDIHQKVLSDVLFQLFPHQKLHQEVYQQVAIRIGDKVQQSKELLPLMSRAMDKMANGSYEKWMTLSAQEKTASLKTLQRTPFFQFTLNEAINGIYHHPDTWRLLGFEGSSLEFGGYINRGFNDIDWLPE